MSNIKLQVGEDYLNELGETKHLESFNNIRNEFQDTDGYTYNRIGEPLLEGKRFSSLSKYKLVTHLPKVNKEPSDEEIHNAYLDYFERQAAVPILQQSWKAAIEWYKQQIK